MEWPFNDSGNSPWSHYWHSGVPGSVQQPLINWFQALTCSFVQLFFPYAQLVFYSLVSLTRLATPSVGTLNQIWIWICYLSNPNYGTSIWRRCCVPDQRCCRMSPYLQEGTIPYCLRGPSTYMWRQKRCPFYCVPSGGGLPHLFVRWLAIWGSLESGASACAIFVTHEHKSTNLTR